MSLPRVADATGPGAAPLAGIGFSVLILTRNEERDLPGCLASIARCNDIVVLDSGSTDRTVEIARKAGARVFYRPFDTFARQRNYAQREIPFRHPWVFHLDADERMTPELTLECGGSVGQDIDGFVVTPKVVWDGRWARHCERQPKPQARFVRAPEFEFVPAGYGQQAAPGLRIGSLVTSYLHDVSRGGEDEWLEKQRRHLRAEWGEFLARSPASAVWAKRVGLALPGRTGWRFLQHYLLRRGFLDRRAGFTYCRLLARRDAMARDELRDLRVRGRSIPFNAGPQPSTDT